MYFPTDCQNKRFFISKYSQKRKIFSEIFHYSFRSLPIQATWKHIEAANLSIEMHLSWFTIKLAWIYKIWQLQNNAMEANYSLKTLNINSFSQLRWFNFTKKYRVNPRVKYRKLICKSYYALLHAFIYCSLFAVFILDNFVFSKIQSITFSLH